MNSPLDVLPPKERRGSRARCVLLTDGPTDVVAERLTDLTGGHAVVDPGRHWWTPRGLSAAAEAKLGETTGLLSDEQRENVSAWWLAVRHPMANTPNWDIASQATVDGREGLLLDEAKAHDTELRGEEGRKSLPNDDSANSLTNHSRIAACIDEANSMLRRNTQGDWRLSRDIRYQMSNRFARAWKLAAIGVPVVLVYLGFLHADEMRDRGAPLASALDWEQLVRTHSKPIAPREVWGRPWGVAGVPVIPLIHSLEVALPAPAPQMLASPVGDQEA